MDYNVPLPHQSQEVVHSGVLELKLWSTIVCGSVGCLNKSGFLCIPGARKQVGTGVPSDGDHAASHPAGGAVNISPSIPL